MNQRKTWEEFRETGLFWWVNRTLHLFGWVIFVEADEEGTVTDVYPARTHYRGFVKESEEEGFTKLTTYMRDNGEELLAEVLEE